MAGKNTAVFGIYPSCVDVESGIDALQAAGFRSTDISALFPENVGSRDFAHEKGTKAPEGAVTGAGSAAVVTFRPRPFYLLVQSAGRLRCS